MSPKSSKNSTLSSIQSAADLMPKNKEAKRILHERATYLAIAEHDKQQQEGLVAYIKFRLGAHERYGIPYDYAKEVIQHGTLTRIPFVPHYIVGVINRRGALLPVFDLKQLFHIQPAAADHSHIILVSNRNMTIGILADHIDGNDAYDPNTLDAALTSKEHSKPDYIVGLHQGVTAIINVDAILSTSLNTNSEINK